VRRVSTLKWLWLSLAVVVLDQLTKYLVMQSFHLYESLPLLPGLNLTLVHNTGAAFSFLQGAGGWQRWFFIAMALLVGTILVVWMSRLDEHRPWLGAALGFIVGGAAGNLLDRVMHGHVIDFIDVYYRDWHWPAFNVADSAISVGVAILVIDAIWLDRAHVSTHSGRDGRGDGS